MKFRPGAAGAALALGALLPSAGLAQSTDAFVLPFGMFRLGVGGTHASYDSRFDASGSRVGIAQGLAGELTPDRFVALRPVSTELGQFFEATAGGPGASTDPDAEALSLGLLDVTAAASRSDGVATIAIGVLPRIELGATFSLGRGDVVVQRLGLGGGSVGSNPDVEANRALLESIGWGELGASALLPTADSPAGIELQSRVTALAGTPMTLPTDTADTELLQSLLEEQYGLPSLGSRVEQWRPGDTELHARALLISTFGAAPVPPDPAGVHLRLTATVGARLATGEEPDTVALLAPAPAEGLSALSAGAAGDLFIGPAVWLSGMLRLTRNRSSEVIRRVAPPHAPLSVDEEPRTVTITSGDVLEIRASPRVRLTESISLGIEYAMLAVGDTRYRGEADGTGADVLDLEGGSLQRLGGGIRYSSLPAYWAGRASLPAEVVLAYQRTLSGPEGAPAGGTLSVTASILPRLWGR